MTRLKQITVIVGILSLTVLEAIALLKGINGSLFAGTTALIGGLSGFTIGRRNKRP